MDKVTNKLRTLQLREEVLLEKLASINETRATMICDATTLKKQFNLTIYACGDAKRMRTKSSIP